MSDSDTAESNATECDSCPKIDDLIGRIERHESTAVFVPMLEALLALQYQPVALEPTSNDGWHWKHSKMRLTVRDMKEPEDYSLFSVGLIREHLGLRREGVYNPSVLLSERLLLFKLEDVYPDELPTRIWEIIRRHYLLWQIGIAHGDISLWNLMVRTSFDRITHAAIMELGQEYPSRIGFERTGTKPFMAIDLLDGNDGTMKPLYLHDLEAMIWCTVWFLEPQPEWVYGSMRQVANNKAGAALCWDEEELPECALDKEAEHLWAPVVNILKEWVFSRPHAVKYLPYPERPEKKDWDSTWMGWKLPASDIVPNTETGKNEFKK
ncbi:hypothetical protein H1R20_g15621, partial [Candolleomyces eurysporus]